MKARVPVVEVMSATPVTITADATVMEASCVMRDREIGSLVVLENGRPIGIVTERDVVTKVSAANKASEATSVRDIMTSPLIAVHPHQEVAEAAKVMAARKIRRLPVIKEGKLVGMITENDIIRVWPQLIEVTREWDKAGLESQFAKGVEGHCDACGVYSTHLVWDRSLLLCPECRGG
jgi:CBS domain-containing protein